MKYSFQFKNEYYGSDWQDYESDTYYLDSVASEIAEDYWSQDPCDPYRFEFPIEIRRFDGESQKFNVTAEASVNFYAREID